MPFCPEGPNLSPIEEPAKIQGDTTGSNCKNLRIDDFSGAIPSQRQLLFTRCWFHGSLKQENISDWTFEECVFDLSTWNQVKFSRCTFRRCHFYKVQMVECSFMNSCVFEANSASPETLILRDTQVNPKGFLSSIKTNLDYLPSSTSRKYQEHRLLRTKARLARLIFFSTKDEPNREIYGDAQKQHILHEAYYAISRHKFYEDHSSKKPQKAPLWRSIPQSIPGRIELSILVISGFLTSWGRSLVRPLFFLLSLILIYSFAYHLLDPMRRTGEEPAFSKAFMESLNVSLVAGYTAYFDAKAHIAHQTLQVTNLMLGLYWYALIVPVVVRRVLR